MISYIFQLTKVGNTCAMMELYTQLSRTDKTAPAKWTLAKLIEQDLPTDLKGQLHLYIKEKGRGCAES